MEVLITCDDSAQNSINFYNPVTGTKHMTLRSPPVSPASLAFIRNEGLLISEANKPFIHIYQSAVQKRILCSGKAGPIALSPSGSFLLVAIEEKINVWQVATGKVVTVLSAHYRPVTVMKFTDDGSYFLTGGQDGVVLAFKFLSVVSKASMTPHWIWSDHSFPVTDLHVGIGGRGSATVFTVSTDRTAKIYSLATGAALLSVAFPVPLTSVVADPAEFAFYVGGTNGTIYQAKLHSPPRSIEHHVTTDAAADGVFKVPNGEGVNCLCISADGKTLASADNSGSVHLWDVGSRQALRTITTGNAKVTNLKFWLGDLEKKPSIVFPEVPKLVENIEGGENITVNVWNRAENVEEEDDEGLKHSTENSVEISNLKVELAKSEIINKKLHQFYLGNILGN